MNRRTGAVVGGGGGGIIVVTKTYVSNSTAPLTTQGNPANIVPTSFFIGSVITGAFAYTYFQRKKKRASKAIAGATREARGILNTPDRAISQGTREIQHWWNRTDRAISRGTRESRPRMNRKRGEYE